MEPRFKWVGDWEGAAMPTVRANNVNLYYETTGQGEPLILIPYLAADQACYAFQVGDYSKHFTCISVDLRGAGLSDKPDSPYSTELFADDIAAFMQAIGVERAHISGLSLGAAVGMWLAAKHPEKVKSLSLHSSWPKSDPFLKTAVEGWRVIAKGLGSVPESPRSCTHPNPITSSPSPTSCAAALPSRSTLSCERQMQSSTTTPRLL